MLHEVFILIVIL